MNAGRVKGILVSIDTVVRRKEFVGVTSGVGTSRDLTQICPKSTMGKTVSPHFLSHL